MLVETGGTVQGTSPGQESDSSSSNQTAQVEFGGMKSRVFLKVSFLLFSYMFIGESVGCDILPRARTPPPVDFFYM